MIDNFKNNNELKKIILKLFIVVLVSNFIALSLTNLLYYSNNNQKTNVEASENSLFTTPASYSTLLSKLNTIDSYFPTYTTTQSTQINAYNGERMNLESNTKAWVNLYYNGVQRGTIYSNSSSNGLVIAGNSSAGVEGQGVLLLHGNPVQINSENIKPDLSHVGDIESDAPDSEKTVASATYTNVASKKLTAGLWLVSYSARFAASSTAGNRELRIGTTSADDGSHHALKSSKASPSGYTILTSFARFEADGNTTLYVKVRQDSGSSLKVLGRLYAIRIR